MKLSKKGEYALRALIHIYFEKTRDVVSIHEIARTERIPLKFLEQIFGALKKGGILTSRRGVAGGYRLSRPAKEIFLGDIIRLIEGPLAPWADKKALEERVAEHDKHSGFYAVLLEVRNAISAILDHTSLEEIATRSRRLMGQKGEEAMFYI